jgi:outer membrane protein OmpA-like peptidoglycan-associated protein
VTNRNVILAAALSTSCFLSIHQPGFGQAQKQPTAAPEPSLVSFSAGALVVVTPPQYDEGWSAIFITDEQPDTGWATPEGVVSPQTIVIELPERTVLKTLTFDLGGTDGEGRGAKDILVEMSDTSATSGFQRIGQVALRDKVDNQTSPVQAEIPGRWVRLTVQRNHGAADYIELMDFRATGKQLTRTPVTNISGTYDTDYNKFHVLQEGTSLTGCYEYNEGVLTGGIEGRVLKFTWIEQESRGPAIMVLSADGKKLMGMWWRDKQAGAPGFWNGAKVSNEVGTCPHWAGGAAQQLTRDLEDSGRARVYGINFDTDSAVIREESRSTVEKIAAVLKQKPDWQMIIEGHTDSTGTTAHNQTLSENRAQSVRDFLVSAGIASTRLKAVGLGASKPLGPNDTELGRAQNRRVELVKQ